MAAHRLTSLSAAALAVTAAGCGVWRPINLEALADRSDTLIAAGNLSAALANDEIGLSRSRPNEPIYWRFYLQKADIVAKKEQNGPRDALQMLQRRPPRGAAFAPAESHRCFAEAKSFYRLAKFQQAGEALAEAAKFAQTVRAFDTLAEIESWNALLASRSGRWDSAEESIRRAQESASRSADHRSRAPVLAAQGLLAMRRNRFEEALDYFEDQLALIGNSGDVGMLARALNNAGWCHFRLGDLDEALRLFERAESINARVGDLAEQQTCLGHIGDVHFEQGDFGEAERYYQRALKIASARGDRYYGAKWLGNLALTAIENGDWQKAAPLNAQAAAAAREIGDEEAALYALVNEGRIAGWRGESGLAEEIYRRAIRTASDDPAPVVDAGLRLAELYAATGHPAEADAQYRAAIALVERTRGVLIRDEYKLSFLDRSIDLYQDYVDFLMARGKTERALGVAEASRARILCEKLGLPASGAILDAGTYRRLASESKSTLVSFWLAPKRSYVWVVKAKEIAAFPLPPGPKLAGLASRYRALIENIRDPLTSEDPSGSDLYRAVLEPIRALLPPGAHVIVVPDGSINALNLETLPVPGSPPHYWLEDVTEAIAPSLNLLTQPVLHNANRSLLLVGNPDVADERYPKLPYAAREMAAVSKHFETADQRRLRGPDATAGNYLAANPGNFSYVHFTAHAAANRDKPLDSAIILSGPGESYRLTARQVMTAPLLAHLVTISACRSAGSRTYAGEGLVGFTWAFFQSGARNVIAGLWDVSDQSTPQLMDTLYSGLEDGKPEAVALREAKLALIASSTVYARPYYWGAFQLYTREARYPKKSLRRP